MNSAGESKNWEKLGDANPYWGVVSHDRFLNSNLSDENLEEFFETGNEYVMALCKLVEDRFQKPFTPSRSLDFGCGVGRLLIPLSKVSKEAYGVDISNAMLREAQKNIQSSGATNASLHRDISELEEKAHKFDLINSFIVFQHIPRKIGYALMDRLFALLESGGICVLHVTFKRSSCLKFFTQMVRKHIPGGNGILNKLEKKAWSAPFMEMNPYNLNRIFEISRRHNLTCFHSEFTNHNNHLGITLYLAKDVRKV